MSELGRTSGSPVKAAFEDGPALIPYVTAGDPDLDATCEYIAALERGGADAIELGIPFSEPVAEGPTIQRAIFRSLDRGTTPGEVLDLVANLDPDVPLIGMTYYNLIYRFGEEPGPEPFVESAAASGLSGLIVPDLPVEESGPLMRACEKCGIDLVLIVAPTTTGARLDRVMSETAGFAYVQARLGTTGARSTLSEATFESLSRLSGYDVPKAVGFGVSEREHAATIVVEGADGVIVGSALIDVIADGIENDRPTADVADQLENYALQLRAGVEDGRTERNGQPEQK